jgi:hypothetical protein
VRQGTEESPTCGSGQVVPTNKSMASSEFGFLRTLWERRKQYSKPQFMADSFVSTVALSLHTASGLNNASRSTPLLALG